MSRPRGPRRSDAVTSPLTLLGELRPAVDALRRARGGLTIGGPLYLAAEAVGVALDRLAALLGHPGHYAAPDHLNAHRLTSPIIPARPEPPAVPSMPDRETYAIVEEDGGTYAVVWASTEQVVTWNGVVQRGLTLDDADDAADHLEALDRIAARRGAGRLDG